MGLFSKKQKYSKDDMPNLMMEVGVDMIGKLKYFNDVDDNYAMAVNLGYFYGFLRMQLNSLTKIEIADKIIEESLVGLNEVTKGKLTLDNFIYVVRTNYNNAIENIKRSAKSNDIITSMAQLYLNDLYQKETTDNVRLKMSKYNINLLYEIILKLTDNIKII